MPYRNIDGAIVIYDITDREEFDNIDKVIEEVHICAPPSVSLFIWANKIDKLTERSIST